NPLKRLSTHCATDQRVRSSNLFGRATLQLLRLSLGSTDVWADLSGSWVSCCALWRNLAEHAASCLHQASFETTAFRKRTSLLFLAISEGAINRHESPGKLVIGLLQWVA